MPNKITINKTDISGATNINSDNMNSNNLTISNTASISGLTIVGDYTEDYLFGIPSAPTGPQYIEKNTQIDISWTPVVQKYTSWGQLLPAITGYRVDISGDSTSNVWTQVKEVSNNEKSATLYGMEYMTTNSSNQQTTNQPDISLNKDYNIRVYAYNDITENQQTPIYNYLNISDQPLKTKVIDVPSTTSYNKTATEKTATTIKISIFPPVYNDKNNQQTPDEPLLKRYKIEYKALSTDNYYANTNPPENTDILDHSGTVYVDVQSQNQETEYTIENLYAGTVYDISVSAQNQYNYNTNPSSFSEIKQYTDSNNEIGIKTEYPEVKDAITTNEYTILNETYNLINFNDHYDNIDVTSFTQISENVIINKNLQSNIVFLENELTLNNTTTNPKIGKDAIGTISNFTLEKIIYNDNNNTSSATENITGFERFNNTTSNNISTSFKGVKLELIDISDQYPYSSSNNTNNINKYKKGYLISSDIRLSLNTGSIPNTIGTTENNEYGRKIKYIIKTTASNLVDQTISVYIDNLDGDPKMKDTTIPADITIINPNNLDSNSIIKYYYGIAFVNKVNILMNVILDNYYSYFLPKNKEVVEFKLNTGSYNSYETAEATKDIMNGYNVEKDKYSKILYFESDYQEPTIHDISGSFKAISVNKPNGVELTIPNSNINYVTTTDKIVSYISDDVIDINSLGDNNKKYNFVETVTESEIKYPASISQKQHNEELPEFVRIPIKLEKNYSETLINKDSTNKDYSNINTPSTWHVFEVSGVSIDGGQICDITNDILGEIGKYFPSTLPNTPSVSDVSQILLSYEHGTNVTREIGTHWFDMKEHYSPNLQFQSDTIENGEGCRNGDTTGVFYARFLDGGGTISKLYVAMNKLS